MLLALVELYHIRTINSYHSYSLAWWESVEIEEKYLLQMETPPC